MADARDLRGQVAVITGGGRGIRAAIAGRLAELGAETVVCGRSRTLLEATAQKITAQGWRCLPVQADVGNLSSVESLAQQLQSRFGRVDVLVNNAGVMSRGMPLHDLAPEQWEAVMNTNLRGVYYCIRSFAPTMIRVRRGHIVNISSLAGKNALPNNAVYAASKWGLNGLSYSIAEELRAHNIRVSVVCPGSVDTELSPHAGKNPSKMLKAEDVAHVVEMLVTQSANSFASEVLLRPTQKP
jgi:3-oxoacyl-[acyl-carrier protein] reductase